MMKHAAIFAAAALAMGVPAVASASIVNLGSDLGFNYNPGGGSDPAPIPGQSISFIGAGPTLDLGAGTYRITNATGLAGANVDYTAWSYNVASSGWAWAFVVADTAGKVITYGEGGGGNSKAAVAGLAGVQNFESFFTLAADTTVKFTLRDYFPGDNAGGIALNVQAVPGETGAIPEPGAWALMLTGFGMAGVGLRRRRVTAAAVA
jgi:hypothetical protein